MNFTLDIIKRNNVIDLIKKGNFFGKITEKLISTQNEGKW